MPNAGACSVRIFVSFLLRMNEFEIFVSLDDQKKGNSQIYAKVFLRAFRSRDDK